MSKQFRLFYLTIASAALILQIFTHAVGQDISATVKLEKRLPKRMEITGKFAEPALRKLGRNLSFASTYAGIPLLETRISDLRAFDGAGRSVMVRRLTDGEYLAEEDFSGFSYAVEVGSPSRPSATPHISWVDGELGILMFSDLFPQSFGDGRLSSEVTFALPTGWSIRSSATFATRNALVTDDLHNVVAFVGDGWRDSKVPNTPIALAIAGERHFSDAEASAMVREIYGEYKKVFGRDPASRVQIGIVPFGGLSHSGEWYAETRGTTVTIASTDLPFKTQSMQRLHEQLRHELIHLWMPNGMSLKGRYDWFYEGFALYESLKAGVRLNRIRFEDFLDTLNRAHRFDDAILPKESMVDASENRWFGGNDRIYARGILVAFLCDLALLQRSKGSRSVETVLSTIFTQYGKTSEPEDANVAVLRLLRSYPELSPTIDRYITGKERMTWHLELRSAGIETSGTGLAVTAKPNRSQKALLDKLGYNNWRNLSQNPK